MLRMNNTNYIYFYGEKSLYGEFSQWYLSDFTDDYEIKYCCCEQYMMAQKALLFNDHEIYDQIMSSNDPRSIKALGRKIKDFNQQEWNQNKYNFVYDANYFKFSQNNKLKKVLKETGDKIICEASPYDKIWGIGITVTQAMHGHPHQGENLLGKALMEVRTNLFH